MVNSFLRKVQKHFNREKRMCFLKANGVGTTRHPYAKRKKKEKNRTMT